MLGSNYEFIGTIGAGGMSVIYKARQLLLNKEVAIKMLHSHLLNEVSIMRFQQEAKAASSLKHANVIAVHDFGISKLGQPYMVMDFIAGKNLAELIKERGSLPLPEAMDIFIAVASALEHAHQNNVLHRDLKPSNIMLREQPDGFDVFLVDFGIAKIIATENGGIAHQLTQTGEIMGSPLYMSPEQCMGKKLDQRSDIYSFGCILYEAVAGLPPHQGDTMLDTIFTHLNEPAKPLHEVRPDINFPEAFEDLCMRLLATQPEDRIQTISEVKARLEAIQAGALKSSASIKLGPQFKFKTNVPLIIAAVGTILSAAGVVSVLHANNTLRAAQMLKTETEKRAAPAPIHDQHTLKVIPITARDAAKIKEDPSYENLKTLGAGCETLDLSQSKVTDGALRALAAIPNLQSLDLSNTNISDRAIDPILKLNSLSELNLKRTKLSPTAIAKLGAMPNLRKLNLDDTNTDDAALTGIGKLTYLSELKLRNANVSDKGIANLQTCRDLKTLSLSGTNLTNAGLIAISKLKLERLDLWDTKVTANGIKVLKNCPSLTELRVSRTNLSEDDLRALAGLKQLDLIELYHIQSLKDSDLKYFAGMKSLKKFYLDDCRIGDGAADSIAKMTNLTGLCLNNTEITNKTLARIENLQKLTNVWLELTRIDDAGMKHLSKLANLRTLSVKATLITDQGIAYVAPLRYLTALNAGHCHNITLRAQKIFYAAHPSGIFEMHYSE